MFFALKLYKKLKKIENRQFLVSTNATSRSLITSIETQYKQLYYTCYVNSKKFGKTNSIDIFKLRL